MLIEQLINLEFRLEKVRTWTDNLKFRTDLRDRVMYEWSVTQQLIVYKFRRAKLWVLLWSATISCLFQRNFHFTWKQKVTCRCPKFTKHQTLMALELSQYCKNGSMFSSSWPLAAHSDCRQLGNHSTPCVCAGPSDLCKQSRRTAPRAWPLVLPSKPLITFWNSLQRNCQITWDVLSKLAMA